MSQLNLELLEISDEQALVAFEQIADHLTSIGVQKLLLQCSMFDNEPTVAGPLSDIRQTMSSVIAEHGYLFRNMTGTFQIPSTDGNGQVNFARRSDGTANASMQLNGQIDQNAERRIGIGIMFNKAFEPFSQAEDFRAAPDGDC